MPKLTRKCRMLICFILAIISPNVLAFAQLRFNIAMREAMGNSLEVAPWWINMSTYALLGIFATIYLFIIFLIMKHLSKSDVSLSSVSYLISAGGLVNGIINILPYFLGPVIVSYGWTYLMTQQMWALVVFQVLFFLLLPKLTKK